MGKLNTNKVGLTLAITLVIVYIVCATLYWILPETLIGYANYLFHGIDISLIADKTMTLGNTIVGLILIFISSYLIGMLFAGLYNHLNKN